MKFADFFASGTYRRLLSILVLLLLVLLIFQCGNYVGYRRALYTERFSPIYGGMNGMMAGRTLYAPFFHDFQDRNSHGMVGEIVSVNMPTVLVKDPNNNESIFDISPTTTIRYMHGLASTSDLRVGTHVVVVGEPNDRGVIHAVFLRIMPPPPSAPNFPSKK